MTETWLNSDICDYDLNMSTYTIYRYDRNICSSNASRGGGVLIAIFKDICSNIIALPHEDIKMVCILCKFLSSEVIISTVYIPSNANVTCYDKYC